MLPNTNNRSTASAGHLSSSLYPKTLTVVYPEIQKHITDIGSLNKTLSALPCYSNGSVRIKPIECDRSIETFQKIQALTEKLMRLIKSLDGQPALMMGSRNYGLLMNMYLTLEKVTILIMLTRKLRGMSAVNTSERAQICLKAYQEYSSFCNQVEKIEKETSLFLTTMGLVITQSENDWSKLAA